MMGGGLIAKISEKKILNLDKAVSYYRMKSPYGHNTE
jgi:hypothetical protein